MVFGALVLRRSTNKAPNVQNGMDLHGIPHGDTWSSMWIYMEFHGFTCTSMWISMDLHVSTWIYMELHGVLCVSTCESIWPFMRFSACNSMELHGVTCTSMWNYMEFHGFTWIYTWISMYFHVDFHVLLYGFPWKYSSILIRLFLSNH